MCWLPAAQVNLTDRSFRIMTNISAIHGHCRSLTSVAITHTMCIISGSQVLHDTSSCQLRSKLFCTMRCMTCIMYGSAVHTVVFVTYCDSVVVHQVLGSRRKFHMRTIGTFLLKSRVACFPLKPPWSLHRSVSLQASFTVRL